uniref:Uncharacterized protein n=1 Tax=Romanomermis culicivorax TaxID=13658 RepID=A0A915HEG8_ROMCU
MEQTAYSIATIDDRDLFAIWQRIPLNEKLKFLVTVIQFKEPIGPGSSSRPTINCVVGIILVDNDRAILCNYWFYFNCANTADQVYDYSKVSNQPSFCPSCLPAINQFLELNKWI